MIIFRRIVAVILALVFVLLFIPIMLIFRVNDTAGNPQFYVDLLRQNDVYNFAYQQVLPVALDQAGGSAGSNSSFNISKYKSNITALAQQALPPGYVQTQVENAITTVLPYALGDTNSFTLQIPLKDRVTSTAAALKVQLNQPGVFPGLYDQLVAQIMTQIYSNSGMPPGLSKTDLEAALRQTAPPEWLLGQVNSALDQIAPYMTKQQDHFTIAIKISDRLDALQSTLTTVLKSQSSYNSMIQTIVDNIVKQNLLGTVKLPAGITFSDQDVRQQVQAALPLDWYQSMVADVVKQVFDYLKGTKDTLSVSLSLADRRPQITTAIISAASNKMAAYINSMPNATSDQLKQLLLTPPTDQIPTFRPDGLTYQQQGDIFAITLNVSQWLPSIQSSIVDALNQQATYDRLISQFETQLNANGPQTLPIGLSLSNADFNQAVSQSIPLSWYRTATTGLAQQVTSYLNGTTPNLTMSMSLADRKPVITAALAAIADQKMQTYMNSLPVASTPAQLAWWANPPPNQLPVSLPAGITYNQIKSALGIDFQQQTQTMVNNLVPNQWTLSQSDVGNALGSSSATFLSDARNMVKTGIHLNTDLGSYVRPALATSLPDNLTLTQSQLSSILGSQDMATNLRTYVQNGISLTDVDLRKQLGSNGDKLDTARNYIASGLVYTEADLNNFIANQDDGPSVATVNSIRNDIGTARKLKMLLWLLPGLILVGIAFLGGRRWASRLMWAASVLLVASALVYVIFGPVYTVVAAPQIHSSLRAEFGEGTTALDSLLSNKGVTTAENAINFFVSGLKDQSLILLISSLAILAGGVVWDLLRKQKGAVPPQ
jgi:hypothetical protein